jgi:hypothetical protein
MADLGTLWAQSDAIPVIAQHLRYQDSNSVFGNPEQSVEEGLI